MTKSWEKNSEWLFRDDDDLSASIKPPTEFGAVIGNRA